MANFTVLKRENVIGVIGKFHGMTHLAVLDENPTFQSHVALPWY